MALIREKRIEEILEDDLSMLGRGSSSSATYEGKVGLDFQRLLGDRSALNLENIQQNSDRVRLRSSEQVPKVIPGMDGRISQVNNDNRYISPRSPTKPLLLSSDTNINSDLETDEHLLLEDTVADSSDISTKMSHITDELEPAASILLDDEPTGESHNSNQSKSHVSNSNNNKSQQKATGMSVRCHCNLAACVTNNYMCKSERRVTEDGKELEAGCFVQELETESTSQHGVLMWNGRVASARRGCIEMLSREKQEKCSDQAGDQVFCCKEDMCNYPKSFYPSVIQNYNSNARASFDASSGHRGIAGMTPNLDHQVWLRAAVIAVPICGLMILVVLILVARRLLRSDEIYKDPDGRRCRRKFTNTSVPHNHHQSSSLSHHHYQLAYHPANSGRGFSPESNNFHIKSVYVEPGNEFLLPPPEPMTCTHCQQPQHVRTSSSSSSTAAAPYTHVHDGSGRKNNNSSETEELVRSCNGNNNCRCSGLSDGTEITCSGNFSDTESHGGRSFSWNSIRPPSIFSGSSPELPDVHRNNNIGQEGKNPNRFNFLSKINRSRSSQSDTNSDSNNRQFNV